MSQNFDILAYLKEINSQPTSASSTLLGMNRTSTSSAARNKWSPRFETWAKPLSETEDQKCENAESMIRTALDGHNALNGLNLKVFAQGSYKANTNVRADSDVDISVRCSNTIYFSLPPGLRISDLGFGPVVLDFNTYKAKVGEALYDHFTYLGVKPGPKSFKILPTSYRIKSDVVPTFEYRKYYYIGSTLYYKTGSCFFTDENQLIVNWPDETYRNAVNKNERTSRRYKKVVRVLKGLRNEMDQYGFASAKNVNSFQLACLAYNIADGFYGSSDLHNDVKDVTLQMWYYSTHPELTTTWTEIDEIKPMFPADKPNRHKECADFLWDLRTYAQLMD